MQIDVNQLKGKTVELGLTGAAVAEKLGIDQSTYYRKIRCWRWCLYYCTSANEFSKKF